ncbi:MAG: HNH endonuclease signature motif containing protein [Vitreoscilla sp.]
MWVASPLELFGRKSKQPGSGRLECTAEHLVPRCEGGTDGPENIVAACAHCNHTRHKRRRPPAPTQYREAVRMRVARGRWHSPWVFQQGLLSTRQGSGEG